MPDPVLMPPPFRLRRYFSLASGAAVLIFTIALSWTYYRAEVAEHIEMSEQRNVVLAQAFANAVWPEYSSHLTLPFSSVAETRDHPQTERLHQTLRRMSRELPVIKIKVYNPQGIALYSSVRSEIGEDKSANPAFQGARGGRTVSELTHRGTMSASEGQIENVDVLSTYLAIRSSDGQVQAVFELYSDVTDTIAAIQRTTLKLLAGLVLVFGLLYAVLLAIVGRADRLLGRQYRELKSEIDARRAVESALRKSEETAAAASRAKTEFLSSMSHELRTPMNAILGFAQLLESDPAAPPTLEQRRSVEQILKAGRHLLELINEVLDLAKIEAGKLTLSVEPVSLDDLLAECLPLVHKMAADRAVRVDASHPTSLRVMGDYMRLKQSLLNLLSNAVKYNRRAGLVTVAASAQRGRVRISVTDTGHGIPEAMHGELFRPFRRLGQNSTEVEGTGIGLALTRNLVTAMGGEIGFRSAFGSGSTFWIELPVAGPDATERQAASPVTRRSADVSEPHQCILYIEDNPANVALMEQIARRIPARFLTAHNAELGIAIAEAERPDLILMDIHLPQMDGYEALARLKANPATESIPVIALTAHAMQKDVERGLTAGFVRYQTKPFAVDGMIEMLRELLAVEA